MWIIMSILSSFFAGITSILAKCGINKVDSDVATGLRTIIIFIFSYFIVLFTGSVSLIKFIDLWSFSFICLSGITTGISWLFYFKALSIGNVSKVIAIDKSSTVLSILFAIILFNETNNILIKIIGMLFILIGTIFMTENKNMGTHVKNQKWFLYAILSAVFGALTSIFAKFGVNNIDSNLGTMIRTFIILIMTWIIIFGKGKAKKIRSINRKELIFICLSGIATGISWLCYYYAIKHGVVSIVIPIDKLSILISIIFSFIVFKERLSIKASIGLFLIVFGTLMMAIFT